MHDFVTSHMGYLENIGSLTYVDLPNVDIFHYAIFQKPHLFLKVTDLIRRVFKCWEEIKLVVADTNFPKFFQ